MNFCTNCGKKLESDMRFCPYCGFDTGNNTPVSASGGQNDIISDSGDTVPSTDIAETENTPLPGYGFASESDEELPDPGVIETPAAEEPSAPPEKRKSKTVIIAVIAVLLLAFIAGGAVYLRGRPEPPEPTETTETMTMTRPTETTTETTTRALVPSEISDKTIKSNVGIVVTTEEYGVVSEGSGFLWRERGDWTFVITCAHVIDDYDGTVTVHTIDEEEYEAEIVGYDVKTDVGLLRIHASGYDVVEIGDSDELKVGDPIYTIGNPDGMRFFGTFSIGHITALNRKLTTESGYEMNCIQHDATVNPGNSGGMLVNGKGEVVGINSSKWVKSGFEGMDFAIPINDALEIIDNLMEYGYVPGRPKLGFRYISIFETNFYAPYYYKYDWPDGSLVIMGVDEDSDLVDKGLNYFDVITEVNGQQLDDEFSIVSILNSSRIGDTMTLKVLRAYSLERVEEFYITTRLIQDRGNVRVITLPDTEMDPETTEPETTRRGLFNLFGF